MNLDKIRNIVNYIIGDVLSDDNMLSPEKFNDLLVVSNLKHFKKKIGIPEEYQIGNPSARQSFELTRKLSLDVLPFKKTMGEKDIPALDVDSLGYANRPTDMYYPSVMYYKHTTGGVGKIREVEIVSDMDWLDRIHSTVKYPTKKYPVANFQADYIRFMPVNINRVIFSYIRWPKTPVFSYSNSDGIVVYDADSSVELEWDEINQIDVIALLVQEIGISIKAQDIFMYGEKVKKEGI